MINLPNNVELVFASAFGFSVKPPTGFDLASRPDADSLNGQKNSKPSGDGMHDPGGCLGRCVGRGLRVTKNKLESAIFFR